ncbi:hypothetical protein [Bradyrhizobium sp.]|uniref:hypothetical protein n=1 Tax=Bradyrhizobium sp. TaxID=376 RepID=UPI001E052505|nr:hypothetical protein [Bradyrhizobium sp.]MBI5320885.1 hypothetical protein [Bradyrhizobium sp.]
MTNDELPARALAKIFALKDQEQQALTLMRSNQRTISELQRAVDINPHGPKAAAWQDEIARLQDVQVPHQARHRTLADLNARIEHYLATLPPDAEVEEAKKVKVKLNGQTRQQAVTALREKIVNLHMQRAETELAALPAVEIKAAAKRWIIDRALKAKPALIATHDKFDLKATYMDPQAYAPVLDTLALLAWIAPEQLEAKINEMVDAMPKPKLALTVKEKAERLAAIAAELADCERAECGHIDAAEEEGTIIGHRPNVGVEALVGIVVSKSQAKAA